MNKKEYQKAHQVVTHLLVKAREDAGYTQKQVAETKIVSQSELSKIENGLRQIDFIILIGLAKLYGKEINYFLPNKIT